MSREIKFRAWDSDQKRMLKVSRISFDGPIEGAQAHCYRGLTLEQFTGLTDMYGDEIYEGDIVHGYDQEPDRDDGYIGSSVTDVVNFKYGAFWIGDSWYKVMVMTPPIIEVIGNVHENPELLEVEH